MNGQYGQRREEAKGGNRHAHYTINKTMNKANKQTLTVLVLVLVMKVHLLVKSCKV